MLTIVLLALACTKNGGDDSGGETADTYIADDGQKPILSDPDAYCYLHSTGDEAEYWSFDVFYTDPQGAENVAASSSDGLRSVEFLKDGVQVAILKDQPVCDTSKGQCFGSTPAANVGIACAAATEYDVRFTLYDKDGNFGRISVQGRKDATGGGGGEAR